MDAQLRIVVKQDEEGVLIYLNQAGRDELVRLLSLLTPEDRHVHLEPYLASHPGDVAWADVVLHEGDLD